MRWESFVRRFVSVASVAAVVTAAAMLDSGSRTSAAPSSVRVAPHDVMHPRPRHQRYAVASTQPLVYHGGNAGIGVVTGKPKVYLVFWGSQWGTASSSSDSNVHMTGDPQNVAPRLQ